MKVFSFHLILLIIISLIICIRGENEIKENTYVYQDLDENSNIFILDTASHTEGDNIKMKVELILSNYELYNIDFKIKEEERKEEEEEEEEKKEEEKKEEEKKEEEEEEKKEEEKKEEEEEKKEEEVFFV